MGSRVKKTIMIVAGEVSSDMYAADLAQKIWEFSPDVELWGVGGSKMAAAGVKLFFETVNWGAIGLLEALKKLPRLFLIYRKLKTVLERERPNLLILVDYPGFNMFLVRAAKKIGIPTLYYIPPSKWASCADDVREAASKITKVAAPYLCTEKIYQEAGADVTFVGHPVVDLVKPSHSREEILKDLGLETASSVISLMPGSRRIEIRYLLPIMLKAAAKIARKKPGARFLVPVSRGACASMERLRSWIELSVSKARDEFPVELVIGKTYDCVSVSDLVVVSSGTATLETSFIGTPMVVVYKVSLLTELIARCWNKLPPHFAIPNLLMNKRVVPELIQRDLTPQRLTSEVMRLLDDETARISMLEAFTEIRTMLGASGASRKVARLALDMSESGNE